MSQTPPSPAPKPPPAPPLRHEKPPNPFGEYGANIPIGMDVLEIIYNFNQLGSGGRGEALGRIRQHIVELRKLRDGQTLLINAETERRRVAENAIHAAAEAIKR